MWVIRLPLAYFLALVLGYGAAGVWSAMTTSMIFQGLLMARRFHGDYGNIWKLDSIFTFRRLSLLSTSARGVTVLTLFNTLER